MKIKKYNIIDTSFGNDVIEYNAYEMTNSNGITCYTIETTSNGVWSEDYSGKTVIRAIDNGNGVKFEKSLGREFDYDDLASLYLLLSFMNKDKSIYSGKIIKSKIVASI